LFVLLAPPSHPFSTLPLHAALPICRISVVFANREYEAWFLAGAASLNGFRGFQVGEDGGVDAESVRNAKGWMTEHLRSGPYREGSEEQLSELQSRETIGGSLLCEE